MNCSCRRSASASSTGRLKTSTPPNADSGSQANALSYASLTVSATAVPQGLLCLTITHAGSLELVQQPPGRVEVEDVVERERLAVLLGEPGEHVRARSPISM